MANTRKTTRPGSAGRKVAGGLAGVGSAAAIVGAGIAALATGAAAPAVAHAGQGGVRAATLTADQVGTNPTLLPLTTQTGVGPAQQSSTAPVGPSAAKPNSVQSAFGFNLSIPDDAPPAPVSPNAPVFGPITDGTGTVGGGPGASASTTPFGSLSLFELLTSPTKLGSLNSSGDLPFVEQFNFTPSGVTSSLLPTTNTGGPVLPSTVNGPQPFSLDPPLPTVAQSMAALYPGLASGITQPEADAINQQIGQSLGTISNITPGTTGAAPTDLTGGVAQFNSFLGLSGTNFTNGAPGATAPGSAAPGAAGAQPDWVKEFNDLFPQAFQDPPAGANGTPGVVAPPASGGNGDQPPLVRTAQVQQEDLPSQDQPEEDLPPVVQPPVQPPVAQPAVIQTAAAMQPVDDFSTPTFTV